MVSENEPNIKPAMETDIVENNSKIKITEENDAENDTEEQPLDIGDHYLVQRGSMEKSK